MKEKHIYFKNPEPGFKERMEQAIEPYRNPNPSSSFESINSEQLKIDYPDLIANGKFLEEIFVTAASVYAKSNPEK